MRPARLGSLDILRGLVMVLMVIDHVRVYSGIPAGGPTADVFLTRWITHFCAPVFVLLAGTGVYFHGRKLGNPGALQRYLITRGLFLVALELTVIRFTWTFNLDFASFTLAGVIWMLGWCMVLLAGLVRLPARTVGLIGLAIVVCQQAFSRLPLGPFFEFFYPTGARPWPGISILYVLIPWIGVMAAGYGFGLLLDRDPAERRRLCLRLGLCLTGAFLVIGGAAVLADSGNARPALFRLLDQRKYPPSQLYLLMTLGPSIAILPAFDSWRGWVADALATFGRVPMFFYLLHIPLIHLLALGVFQLREGVVHPEWFATAPFVGMAPEHRWPLPLLYLVFAVVVALLYWPCRWFAAYKSAHRKGWVSYV